MNVLLAVLIPVLLAAIALAADLAVFYYNWAQLQQAADAAVLAGATYLPSDPSQATTSAKQYAALDNVANSEITSVTAAADNMSISITLTRAVPYYFGQVLGLTTSPVVVAATAGVQTAGSATGILPVGVQYNTSYKAGQQITLLQGVGPGNWGALALGGNGAANFETNVQNGYSGSVSAGSWVSTETGKMTGPVRSSFDARITAGQSSDPGGTYLQHTPSDARAVVVPMVDFGSPNGKSQIQVLGFAELWLVSVNNQINITCYFISQVVPGSQPSSTANSYGAYTSILLK